MGGMRFLTPTLTAAATTLVLAGCGGSASGDPSGAAAGSRQDKAFEGALKFARCMRAEGLDFPDPKRDSNGMIRMGRSGGQRPDPNDPRQQAAQEECGRHLEEGGGPAPDAAQQAKFQDAFLEYARCMRREGVNIPDPKPGEGGGGIVFRVGDPNAPDPDSPRYKAADRTCHPALAEVDKAIEETP